MEPESDDSVLLERIFLGVVMAETDQQFEKIINQVLPSVLLKLANPNENVKNKVVELLTHISKRVKATKGVQLPMETLLAHYSDPSSSIFIINFAIIYIKVGFPRLPSAKKIELMPKLLDAALNKPLQHQESLLVLLLSSLGDIGNYPKDPEAAKNIFGLADKETLKKLLLSILVDVFMFPYGCTGETNLSEISLYSYRRLVRDGFIDTSSDSIEKLKVNCLKFVSSGLFSFSQEYPALVLASADPRSSVSQPAGDRIKRIFPDIDTSKSDAISLLYQIYLGADSGGGGGQTGGGEHKRPPISMRLRLKILQHISKFTVLIWPIAIKVLFESLYGYSASNQKLRMYALNYAAVMIQYLEEEQLRQVGGILLESGLLKLLKAPDLETSLRERAFTVLGQLVQRCPYLVEKDLTLLSFIFQAIEEAGESETARVIRDAASVMCPAFGLAGHGWLSGLLEHQLSSASPLARSLALMYTAGALQASPLRTYLLLSATCLSDEEVRREAKKSLYGGGKETIRPCNFPGLLSLVTERDADKPHPTLLLKEIILYLRSCLSNDAGVESSEPIAHPSEASPQIGTYLAGLESSLLDTYLALLFRLLAEESGVVSLSALLEVIGCLYPAMADKHLDKIHVFKKLALDGNSEAIKELSSEIWGLLAARIEPPPYGELSTHLTALGHLLCRVDSVPIQHLTRICESIQEGSVDMSGLNALCLVAQSDKLHLPASQLGGLIDRLLEIFVKNDSNKVKEKAIAAVGYIATAQVETKLRSKVIEKLLENPKEIKDIEVILASGQTLVCGILGSDSPLAGDPWTRENKLAPSEGASGLAGSTLEKILSTITKDRRPGTRQTLCFWLLAVTKHCSKLEVVKNSLSEIQNGFIDLLNDNNGLIQEGAGKGLALVYEAGDESTRAELVKTVVDQLGSGRRLGQVSGETKLFEEGQLGETPTGEKLSTYKELCTLASDLNQPDLIYKFMALAHHNAIWNSKKGAAFTVASLAQKAGPELEGHLPSVLVKLFRYQYDPVGHVRQAMAGIWSSLASQDTVLKYRKEIFDDLVANLTAREWRVRYSSCRGIAELMRGPSGTHLLQEKKSDLPELWKELFRVMDDIHKDTRIEATRTAAALAKLCAIPEILPVLLEKGITNPAAEVRLLSIATVNEMLKKGLPESDVVRVIAAYLKHELDPRSFVQYVKVGMLEELSGCLIDSLKHSVRGGRVSAANFITLLSHHLTTEEIQPYVGKFLGALLGGVKDKNRRIRSEFGSTIGHLLRCAKTSSVVRLLERLTNLYVEHHTEEEVKWGVTEAVDSAIRQSQEAVELEALPLVFLAKHEILNQDKTNKKRIEMWEENYRQICPGSGRLNVHQTEIAGLLLTALRSPFWGLKAQGGRGARSLVEKVPELKLGVELFAALSEAIEGRVWPGKEALLSPLPLLGNVSESQKILVRECERGGADYRAAGLGYLAETRPPYSLIATTVSGALAREDERRVREAGLSLLGHSTLQDSELDEALKTCFACLDSVPGACLETLSDVTRARSAALLSPHLQALISALRTGLGNRKLASSRRSALNIIQSLQDAFNDEEDSYSRVKEIFNEHATELETDTDPGVRSRTIAIKEKFKEHAI